MYYIYHIPGVKIGCSNEPNNRVQKQGYTEYEILEEHEDIYVASEREMELQKEYGYKVDGMPYYKSKENRRKAGIKTVENGHLASIRTKENQSKGGKTQGKKNVESGHLKSVCSKGGKIGGKIAGKIAGRKAVESGRIYEMGIIARKKAAEVLSVSISVYDKKTKQYIGTYTSMTDCAKQLKIQRTSISSFFNGKLKSTGGYIFKKEPKKL